MPDETRIVGVGAAVGIIAGSVLFVVTDSPVWIGLGIVFGAAIGGGWSHRKTP